MLIKIGSRVFQNIQDLENLVVQAATEYELNGYAEDFTGVEISDVEYDELYRELKKLNPKSSAFKGTSPSKITAKGDVVVHDPPMTSIAKADGDDKENIYKHWIEDCAKRLGKKIVDLQVAESFKHDGVAVRVNYVKGKLASAGLRPRDGINGSDVTRHMKHVQGVPLRLPLPLTLSLNGEIECWDKDFAAVNARQDDAGEDLYKNPRNYTAGCMNRDDADENKDAGLRIAFYSITGFDDWQQYYTTEVERSVWAKKHLGLSDFYIEVKNHSFKNLQLMEEQSKKLPFYTDGVVLKVNDLEDQDQLGHTGDDPVNSPRWAIAWKFAEETADAFVSRIEWNASRTGRVVPTAIFDAPFILADTENTRATCNNYGWMECQGLGPGAKVRCKKGGKIIPNIMQVLKPVKNLGAPKKCPSCSTVLHLVESSSGNKDLICPDESCAAKQSKGWMFYIAKLGGKGLGLSAMEKILNTNKVRSLPDLYDLNVDDLKNVGFGERQAVLAMATIFNVPPHKDNDALLEKIKAARSAKFKIEAWKFFAALGIAGAGETVGKMLVSRYGNFDSIKNATRDDLLSISGIGPATADAIIEYFDKNDSMIVKLLKKFDLQYPKTGNLTGKNFCLTGSFGLGKKHWQTQIENLGGTVQSSVGKSTDYLVQEHGKSDGSPSEKEIKAKKLGIPVISVGDLEKILKCS